MSFFQFGSIVERLTNVTAAGGTTTLVNTSTQIQVLTTSGSNGQVFQLPDATTMVNGMWFEFYNESAGLLTINNSSSTTLYTVSPGLSIMVKLTNNGTAAGIWASLAATAASSGGSKNYLTSYTPSLSGGVANPGNGNFENSTTSGWSLAHSSLSSFIPTSVASGGNPFSSSSGGSAASGNLSLSIVSSSQLSGSYSASLASTAASTAGDMIISNAFYIDLEDQAKMMTVQFRYKAVSGTFNFSGTTSNSFAIWIYDCTNNAWIMPAGVYGMVQGTGVGYATNVTFQTTANSTRYQLALVNINATSGAYTLYLDDFIVGPQTAPSGPAMTDWTSQSTSLISASFGTITNATYYGRRVGDTFEGEVTFIAGTPTASVASVALPSGLSIDFTKISTLSNGSNVGLYTVAGTSGTATINFTSGSSGTVFVDGSTNFVYFGYQVQSSAQLKANASGIAASGTPTTLFFRVPISGWSSNTSQSSDTDTRVVGFNANGTPTGTITSSFSLIKYPTVNSDTHASYSTGTGLYTVPVTGYYNISASVNITNTSATSGVGSQIGISLNGAGPSYSQVALCYSSGATTANPTVTVNSIYLTAGTTVQIQALSAGTSLSIASGAQNYFTISRVCGPAVIAATESVNAKYYMSANTSVTANTQFNFDTKVFDSHNATTTGSGTWKYTAPVSGTYNIMSTQYLPSGSTVTISVYKNGTIDTAIGFNSNATGGPFSGTTLMKLNAGDYIDMRPSVTDTFGGGTAPYLTHFSILRVGN